MESMAAARMRLHFQSFGMTAKQVHAFYRSSGVDRIAKNGVSKIKVTCCGCMPISVKFPRIYHFVSPPKKVIATGMHALALIYWALQALLLLHGWCLSCTTGSFAHLIFLVARTRSRQEWR